MLGNQALLDNKANRGARDLPFNKKKDFYKEQALELTKALAECEHWNTSRILENQKEMASNAHVIWSK